MTLYPKQEGRGESCSVKIGLLGAGTIGFGVVELADKTADLEIVKILDRRDIPELRSRLTTDPDAVLTDPEIDTVIELLGGVEPAFTWVNKALRAGKNVVTANKFLVSEKLTELLAAAKEGGAQLRFSAAVGGGIPYLVNLLRARRVDEVLEVGGILNGTTNYILTKMTEENLDFSDALKQAQELGYAEANPTADISGGDTHCKIALASAIAWNGTPDKHAIPCEGITRITARDLAQVRSMGYGCKLLARAVKAGDAICATVEPTLVPAVSVTAGIRLVENMAYWVGKNAGMQRFTGAGAGRYATAYAVLEDVRDIPGGAYSFEIGAEALKQDAATLTRRYLTRGLAVEGERNGDYTLTAPMAPAEMHAKAKAAEEARQAFFFAGLFE